MKQTQEDLNLQHPAETVQQERFSRVAQELGDIGVAAIESSAERRSDLLVQKVTESLEQGGEVGRSLIPTYLAALDESSRVRHTILDLTSARNNPALETGPAIHEETETGDIVRLADSWRAYEKFLRNYPGGKAAFAKRFGEDPETLTTERAVSLIAAHELGHVEERSFKGDKASSIRKEEMDSLPLPGRDPSELARFLKTPKGLIFWHKNKDTFRSEGITSRSALVLRQREAYCKLSSERAADRFAIRVRRRLDEAGV